MHRCLSCNQPCSLFSAFCDACRASLLARRDQVVPEEQPEMVKAGGGNDSEGGYSGREMGEGVADLVAFPQPEAPLVGSLAEQAATLPQVPEGEDGAWTRETSGIYAMETLDNLVGAGEIEHKAGLSQATHSLVVPPRPRRVMPRNVKRALLVFCIVGALALLTDGILLALSLSRHHTVADTTRPIQSGMLDQQVASPASGRSFLTPTSAARVSAVPTLVLSAQRLVFSASQDQSTLGVQTITLSANRHGFSWRVEQTSTPPAWLHLSAWQGNVAPGATAAFTVNAYPTGLAPGSYTTGVLVKAFGTQGQALAGSPATLAVILNVHPSCMLSVTPEKLSFAAVLVSAPTPQTLTLSTSSGCTFPVYWQVSADASWVTFSNSSGTIFASGSSIIVQASSSGKLIGSSTAHITFSATDSSGAPLVVSPATITATLTVLA